jgi:hypothetical protein
MAVYLFWKFPCLNSWKFPYLNKHFRPWCSKASVFSLWQVPET